ncbi:MAG: ABC transporter permease DevC [Desmonostoc vinosum HA7617-LM4]|jgi:putative ABC transport system permease protein|nr:ABC transporter permease DevC [Desmonostoc vinosum HA7617-LM4]
MKNWLYLLGRRTPLGWLQLSRHKGRLVVALAGTAFADVLMFMQLGFQESLYESNTKIRGTLDADIVLVSPKAKNTQNLSTFSRRRLYQARDIPGVAAARALYSGNITWKNPVTRQDATLQIMGFAPDYPAFKVPEMNQQLDKIKLPDVVLFDRTARGKYQNTIAQINQGQPVTTEAEGRTITVRGLFSLGASFGTDGLVVTSDQNFLMLFPRRDAGSVSLGLIDLQADADPQQVVQQLRQHLPNDVKAITIAEFIDDEQKFWRTESPIGFIFTIGASMAFVIGAVIVYQVLSTDVNAHLKEYATFKAMGYHHSYLLGVVLEESIILAFLGFVPGLIVPIGVYYLSAKATALPIHMTVSRAVTVLILTIIMCLISGAIATRKLQSADPADMF